MALAAWFFTKRRSEQERVREIKRREAAGHRQEASAHVSRAEQLRVEAAEKRREADELDGRGERALAHAQRHSGAAEEKESDL